MSPQTPPLRFRSRFLPVLFLLLAPPVLAAQPTEAGEGGVTVDVVALAGAATDEFEDVLPLSPQLALRAEVRILGGLALGVEGSLRFVNEALECPAMVGARCDDDHGLRTKPIASPYVRVEFPGERWPLYLLGFLGRTVADGGSPVKGGGIGVVLRRRPGVPDLLVEVRYRYDLWLPRRRLEYWEFMVGIGVL